MKIKNGKIFYKLTIEKTNSTKRELLEFVRTKTTDGGIINQIEGVDFDISQPINMNLPDVRLDISIKKAELVLLFGTLMQYPEFSSYLGKWFN